MYDTAPAETLRYHHEMLMDKVRVESYQQAILSTVRKGDVVLDLGCGTGILSLFACMAGASRVYAVEAEPVLEIAKRVIEDNGYTDRITFMNDWSTYAELPEKVDVILTETMGNLGFEEGILGWVADARKRFLKDNGRIIPKEVELIMAPVKYNPDRDRSAAWKKDLYRLDFSSIKEIADNQIFPIRLDHRDVLGKPESFVKADLNKELPAQFEAMRQFKIDKKGVLQGLAGWFHARLTEEIVLTNAPPSNIPSWWQVFFPLVEMIEVEPGEHVSLQISLDRDGGTWSWKVKHGLLASLKGNEARWDFEHRTSGGEILPKRDEHDFQIKPTLDPDAYLDLHILQAMDGEHSLEDIALDVMERFPGTFRNIETAREHMYSFYEDYGRSP